jgi:hypothetical protein
MRRLAFPVIREEKAAGFGRHFTIGKLISLLFEQCRLMRLRSA